MSYAQRKQLSGNRTLSIILVAILQLGLGYAIVKAQRFLQTDKIFAGIILIGVIGLAMEQFFRWAHRAAFPWLHGRN